MRNHLNCYQAGGYAPTQLTDPSFIPTYAGTPLEDAKQYGAKQAQDYQQNIQDLTKLDILNAQRQVLPGDAAESEKYNQELKSQFADLAKKGDYENMTHQVNELARRHFNNKDIKLMSENYAEAEKAQAHVQSLADHGLHPLFYNDPNEHQSITYDENGKKVHNKYTYKGEAPLEWDKKKRDIFDVIKPSMSQMSKEQAEKTLEAVDGYIATGTWRGIDATTKKLLSAATSEYESTPHYRQELRAETEAYGGGEEGKAKAEQVIRQRIFDEGLLHNFSETHPQYLENWIQKKQMSDKEKEPTRVPNLETGVKFKDVPISRGLDLPKFDPNIKRGTAPTAEDVTKFIENEYPDDPQGLAKNNRSIRAYALTKLSEGSDKPWERGTAEQRAVYEKMARATQPKGSLDKYYSGDPKKGAEAEKQFLYSPEVYAQVQDRTKKIENKLNFNTVLEFAPTPKGQQEQKAATDALQTNLNRTVFYDFASGKIFSMEGPNGMNPVFSKFIPDPRNLQVTAQTAGINPYGKITKDPRFYNSQVVNYFDPKTQEYRKLLAANSVFNQEPGLAEISDLWSEGTTRPNERITMKTLGGDTVEYEDDGNGNLKVYKINNHSDKDGYTVSNYEDFYNAIENSKAK